MEKGSLDPVLGHMEGVPEIPVSSPVPAKTPKAVKAERPEAPKGQHIFHAAYVTAQALRWKDLRSQGKHDEAMPILEDIIAASTPMFERLATFEEFDHTVDLPTLVQAAREKMVKWLDKWDPKFKPDGGLFSWLSTSLTGDVRVCLADGTLMRIDEIVKNKAPVEVLSWNPSTDRVETRRVVAWHRNPGDRRAWRKLSVRLKHSRRHAIYVTGEHEMLTQRGWVQVDDLVKGDKLYMLVPGTEGLKWDLAEAAFDPKMRRPVISKTNVRSAGGKGWYTPDFDWKYDVTVEGTFNFLAEGIVVHNCSRHAFLSEISKVTQHRRRFHAIGDDNLEKFFGEEDHASMAEDAALEAKERVRGITVRWGSPIEQLAVRYAIDAMVEPRLKDRNAIIKGLCFATGVSPDMGKFFYNWGLFALRDAMWDKIHIPFTEEDILRNRESYTHVPDLIDIVGFPAFRRIAATMGGARIRIPTLGQMARDHEAFRVAAEIEAAGLDPGAVSSVARKYQKTDKTAQELFDDAMRLRNPDLGGEHYLYGDPEQ